MHSNLPAAYRNTPSTTLTLLRRQPHPETSPSRTRDQLPNHNCLIDATSADRNSNSAPPSAAPSPPSNSQPIYIAPNATHLILPGPGGA